MPIKRVQFPDGSIKRVEVPEGATNEQIIAFVQSQHQAPSAQADFSDVQSSVSQSQPEAIAGPLAPSVYGERNAPSMASVNAQNQAYAASPQAGIDRQAQEASQQQAKQRMYRDLPAPVRGMVGMGKAVGNAVMGLGQLAGVTDESDVAALRARDAYLEGDGATTAGNVAGDLALMAIPASRVSKLAGAGRLAQLAANTGSAAAFGGLQPVAEGESRGQNATVSGLFGAGGTLAAGGLSRLGQRSAAAIDPLKRELSEVAKRFNIPLHASQVSSSLPAKVVASAGKYLPFSGAGKAAANQQGAFNAALGETFGVKGATRLSDDVVSGGRREISKTYDEIFKRNDVALDKGVMDEMKEVLGRAGRSLDKDQVEVVRKNIDYIIENSTDGKLPGGVYQSLRGDLAGSGDKLGKFLGDIRKALDGAAERSVGPQDAAALKQANSQWANLRTVQDALKQAGGASENVNPANLWNLVRKGSTKEMRELARLGQVVLKDPIPDSGTAQRSLMYGLLGGGVAWNPAAIPLLLKSAAAGATVGRVANSPLLANFMLREGRGQGAQSLARIVQAGTPAAAPTAANEVNKKRKPRKDER